MKRMLVGQFSAAYGELEKNNNTVIVITLNVPRIRKLSSNPPTTITNLFRVYSYMISTSL